jgi:hypothetical protein
VTRGHQLALEFLNGGDAGKQEPQSSRTTEYARALRILDWRGSGESESLRVFVNKRWWSSGVPHILTRQSGTCKKQEEEEGCPYRSAVAR